MPHHVPCDFVDGEDASVALQSLLLPLSSPLHGWLGAAALNPEEDGHDQDMTRRRILFMVGWGHCYKHTQVFSSYESLSNN